MDVEDDYTGEVTARKWVDAKTVDYSEPDQIRVNRPPDAERVRAAEEVLGLTQAGHGFAVQTVTRDPAKTVVTRCKYCDRPMDKTATDWLCELGAQPGSPDWDTCGCNWCVCRRQYEAGTYRTKGRPRTQCGSTACKRKLRNEQQRERRAKVLVAA
ncbi:hypothetical protein [Mycolicibacterium aurum]|uniref:hypothetical protein n=1 Tax=Mycolicibacterium aurum TaxID=1791 RepID=UPI000F84CDCD|nr:hypothetical protein [Mycolicibacterium aurum]